MSVCEKLRAYLADEYRHLPESRYISILLLRTTQSEAIFRTEGSGEGCNREFIVDYNGNSICRIWCNHLKCVSYSFKSIIL